MLRSCTAALALMAAGVVAAPPPVFRPGKSPCEVMLAGLRKTGKATGPRCAEGGTWTLTAEKVEGDRLTRVGLRVSRLGGRENLVLLVPDARIKVKDGKNGLFTVAFPRIGLQGAKVDATEQESMDLWAEP